MSSSSSPSLDHQIFVLDAELEGPLDQSKQDTITTAFVEHLLKVLSMLPLGKLEVYPAVDLAFPGWSFIQPITTSHASGHYFEEKDGTSHIHIDIYSCKSFDWQEVIRTAHEHFKLGDWSADFIFRDVKLHKRKIYSMDGTGEEVTTLHTVDIREKEMVGV